MPAKAGIQGNRHDEAERTCGRVSVEISVGRANRDEILR